MENQNPTQPNPTPTVSPVPDNSNIGPRSAFPFPRFLSKRIAILALILIATIFVVTGALAFLNQRKLNAITDFESCAAAGFPVAESYPATCRTGDGRTFTQVLSEEEQKKLLPPDPTADWQTYYDPVNLISIKYPSDTSLEKDTKYNLITANTVPVISISREEGDRNTNTPEWYRVQIYIENNPNNLSAQQIVDAYLKKITLRTIAVWTFLLIIWYFESHVSNTFSLNSFSFFTKFFIFPFSFNRMS